MRKVSFTLHEIELSDLDNAINEYNIKVKPDKMITKSQLIRKAIPFILDYVNKAIEKDNLNKELEKFINS